MEGSKTTNYYYQDGEEHYTTDEIISRHPEPDRTDGNISATQRYGSDHTDYLLHHHKDIQEVAHKSCKKKMEVLMQHTGIQTLETTINGDNKAENEVCYTGGIYDQRTGLYYLNARYYNPEDGGFLTEMLIEETK